MRIRLHFPADGVEVFAKLLQSEAPETCRIIGDRLPFEGDLTHGRWSGPEAYLLIDPSIRIPPENQTFHTLPGDIAFYSQKGGRFFDWPDDMSELAFIYGRGAQPSMMDGPIRVNIFGRIDENLEVFAAMCARLHTEGMKPFRVERVE